MFTQKFYNPVGFEALDCNRIKKMLIYFKPL